MMHISRNEQAVFPLLYLYFCVSVVSQMEDNGTRMTQIKLIFAILSVLIIQTRVIRVLSSDSITLRLRSVLNKDIQCKGVTQR